MRLNRLMQEQKGRNADGKSSGASSIMINDKLLAEVHRSMGQVYMDRRRWRKASLFFVMSKQTDKLAECLFQLGDFSTLKELQAHLPGNSPVHKDLAAKYESIGLCDDAVRCYVQVKLMLSAAHLSSD